jgi:hypothetical protein
MCEANRFSSWSKMLGSIRGRPVSLKRPIQIPEGDGALVARMAAGHAGCAPRSAADGGGYTVLHAGQRGRAAAGVRPVVRLSDVVRGARLRGDVLGAHHPAEGQARAKGAVRRSGTFFIRSPAASSGQAGSRLGRSQPSRRSRRSRRGRAGDGHGNHGAGGGPVPTVRA